MTRTPKKKFPPDDLAAHLTPEPGVTIPDEPTDDAAYGDDEDFVDPSTYQAPHMPDAPEMPDVSLPRRGQTLAGFSFDDDDLFAAPADADGSADEDDAQHSPGDFDFESMDATGDQIRADASEEAGTFDAGEPEITLMAAVPELIGGPPPAAGRRKGASGRLNVAAEQEFEAEETIIPEPAPSPQRTAQRDPDFERFEDITESGIAISPEARGANKPFRLPDELQTKEPAFDRPVPRVSIQAFCDNPSNGMVIQKAAEDRRLSKAHVTVHMGGMQGAVEYFQDTPTPNLVFVEVPHDTSDVFNQLARLAEVCDPGTKVVLIGQYNDITLYRALMRQGVSEYLVPPFSVPQVIDTISALFIDPEAPPIGRCVSVIGSKGGIGASTLAHNVAWLIAEEMMEDVTLVDFDLYFGTGGLDFNQDPVQGVADALNAPERLDDQLLERLLVKCTERLSLFSSPAAIDREFNLEPEAFEAVLETVRASVPVMIVDLPHLWESWTRRVLLSSDEIVLVTSPDLAGLRNTKNMVELLKNARPNDTDPKLVVNFAGVPKRPEIPVKDFAEAVGLEPVLVLPFDPQLFGAAANNGQMIAEMKPDHKASAGLRHLAGLLSTREVEETKVTSWEKFMNSLLGKK